MISVCSYFKRSESGLSLFLCLKFIYLLVVLFLFAVLSIKLDVDVLSMSLLTYFLT